MKNFFAKYGETESSNGLADSEAAMAPVAEPSNTQSFCNCTLNNLMAELNTAIKVATDLEKHASSVENSYTKSREAGLDDIDIVSSAVAILTPYARSSAENAMDPSRLVSTAGYTVEEAMELAPIMARDTVSALNILFTLLSAGEITGTRTLIVDHPEDTETTDAVH